ncbi:hypothetical protein M9H77_02413 [Catharanthus roseus]|uniref:Uncharacterized protein n=1 Tax=Catharanthus roseus TaxID=4058 RepID=A0ACC0C8D2_CATRO|nr:hypothetical protein M9H77_02413 [Catharanthus roseus]
MAKKGGGSSMYFPTSSQTKDGRERVHWEDRLYAYALLYVLQLALSRYKVKEALNQTQRKFSIKTRRTLPQTVEYPTVSGRITSGENLPKQKPTADGRFNLLLAVFGGRRGLFAQITIG